MAILVAMAGLPGSGKSTYAKKIKSKNWYIVSTDKIRFELFGEETNQENNAEVFQAAYQKTRDLLQDGVNVIFDATNIAKKQREKLLSECGKYATRREIFFMDTRLGECKRRNKERDRVVPNNVINNYKKILTFPNKSEGWNSIKLVRS